MAGLKPDLRQIPDTRVARSTNAVNALIHLYRAEVGRMTAYRSRLDTTTNWAITSSAVVATFALGDPEITHAALLFLMVLNYFFLLLEARRFRHYEASRQRVQLMERSFYPEVLERDVNPGWIDPLLETLRDPRPPVSRLVAVGWRLRRNYLWIYAGVFLTWLAKLDIFGGTGVDLGGVVSRAAIGSVPGWVVCGVIAGFYAWLAVLAARAGRSYPLCEDW